MRILLLPLLLTTAACTTPLRQTAIRPMFTPSTATPVERRVALGDPALDFISVGASPDLSEKRRSDGVEDATLRQYNTAANAGAEQMDNWWAETGAALIPAPVPD